MQDTDKKYLTINEFANRIHVSPVTLRRWDKNGKLKPHHYSISGYRMYSEQQVSDYLKKFPVE